MGDIVYLALVRRRRKERRLQTLRERENACRRTRHVSACTRCRDLAACAIWQEYLASALEWENDNLEWRPRAGDVVVVGGEKREVLRVRTGLEILQALEGEEAARFGRQQERRLGSGWLGTFYLVEVESPDGGREEFEWHQVKEVLRRRTVENTTIRSGLL